LLSDRELTDGLAASGATAIAFETVTDGHGRLPLLAPMSEVAGRLAAQFGGIHLTAHDSALAAGRGQGTSARQTAPEHKPNGL
jgi:alanine dehydrogenase